MLHVNWVVGVQGYKHSYISINRHYQAAFQMKNSWPEFRHVLFRVQYNAYGSLRINKGERIGCGLQESQEAKQLLH